MYNRLFKLWYYTVSHGQIGKKFINVPNKYKYTND